MSYYDSFEFLQGMVEKTSNVENQITEEDILKRYDKCEWSRKFILDRSPQIILMGGRRGAKTTNVSAKIGFTDLFYKPEMSDSFIFYASKTFDHAMSMMWEKLKNFRDFYDITDWNMSRESSGVIQTPRCQIRLLGFNDIDSIGKALGQPFKLFAIDESQEIRSDILQTVTRDAGAWGILDASGQVVLLGNPPRNKYHFFSQEWLGNRYPRYHTNLYKNPFLSKEKKDAFIEKQRQIRGEIKGEESPEFRRMAFGDVVFESSNSVFTITPDNYYTKAPDYNELEIIVGVDLGWRAHDAIVVLGWHKTRKDEQGKIYLLEEHQAKRQSMQELAKQVDDIAEKYGAKVVVLDTGGLAIKSLPDLVARYSKRQWIPAEKREKVAWIKLLQTEIRHARFLLKEDSLFLKEINLIEWDETHEKLNDKLHHSDLLDAILYGSRYCLTNLKEHIIETKFTDSWSEEKKRLAFGSEKQDDWSIVGNDDW